MKKAIYFIAVICLLIPTGSVLALKDSSVKIVKSDGSIGTTNKASATTWSSTEGFFTYGNSADLWGETWTASDINNSNFGVVLSTVADSQQGTASVDYVRITITYSPPQVSSQVTVRQSRVIVGKSAVLIK